MGAKDAESGGEERQIRRPSHSHVQFPRSQLLARRCSSRKLETPNIAGAIAFRDESLTMSAGKCDRNRHSATLQPVGEEPKTPGRLCKARLGIKCDWRSRPNVPSPPLSHASDHASENSGHRIKKVLQHLHRKKEGWASEYPD